MSVHVIAGLLPATFSLGALFGWALCRRRVYRALRRVSASIADMPECGQHPPYRRAYDVILAQITRELS